MRLKHNFLHKSQPIWAWAGQKIQFGMCAKQRLRPACASVQSYESLWVAKFPMNIHMESEVSYTTATDIMI